MYFGIYQIASRHREFDALPYEVPCAGPSLFARLLAFFRRAFH
jgi:hypothetical protein